MTVSDLREEPVRDKVEIDFQPDSGPHGAGGENMTVRVNMGGATDLTVTGIACSGGTGTLYRVRVSSPRYRDYSFFQTVVANAVTAANDDVDLTVNADRVKGIAASAYEGLSKHLQSIFTGAEMQTYKREGGDLVGLTGKALYGALGALRQAAFLNFAAKLADDSTAERLPMIGGLIAARQDRIFAFADPALEAFCNSNALFRSASPSLHAPLEGFDPPHISFKTHRDAHAGMQLTFQRETGTARVAVDIDMDESSGFKHGLEVIRNHVGNQRTNPYLMRELMLLGPSPIDPGYRFTF